MNIKQETLELILSLSNTLYLPSERAKTEHLNRIREILQNEFPNLKEAI